VNTTPPIRREDTPLLKPVSATLEQKANRRLVHFPCDIATLPAAIFRLAGRSHPFTALVGPGFFSLPSSPGSRGQVSYHVKSSPSSFSSNLALLALCSAIICSCNDTNGELAFCSFRITAHLRRLILFLSATASLLFVVAF